MRRNVGNRERYATIADVVAGEKRRVSVDPYSLARGLGYFPVNAPEAEVGNGTDGLLAAIAACKLAGGGRIELTQRRLLVDYNAINIDFGNVVLSSARGTEIVASENVIVNDTSLIKIGGAGFDPDVPFAQLTTAVPDPPTTVSPWNTFRIDVTDSSPVQGGDYILVKARPHANNYFYGVSGAPGFSPIYNSEIRQVRGTTTGKIELASALRYPYSISGGAVVDIFKMNMIENVRIEGIRLCGLGYGPVDPDNPGNYPWNNILNNQGFLLRDIVGLSMTDIDCRRLASFGVQHVRVLNGHATNFNTVGIDYSDPNAWHNTDDRHGAMDWQSCQDYVWEGGRAMNVRHIVNPASTPAGPICDNIVVMGLTSDGITDAVFGGHISDRHKMIACTAKRGGAYNRGKNFEAIGCTMEQSGPYSSGTGQGANTSNSFPAGSGEAAAPYPELPNMGRIRYIGNKIRASNGVYCENSFESMIIGLNDFDTTDSCIYLVGKSFTSLQINDNIFDLSRHVGTRVALLIENKTATIPMATLKRIRISNNEVINGSGAWDIDGTISPADPADDIVITGTVMSGTDLSAAFVTRLRRGFFGDKIAIDDTWVHGSVPAVTLALDAEPGYFKRLPQFSGYHVFEPRNIGYGTAFPSTAGMTVSVGDTFRNTTTGALSTVTVAGTLGATSGTCLGTITTGTPNLTLTGTAAFDIMEGMYITVAGAGPASADMKRRVLSATHNGSFQTTACVLDGNAGTSVSGASVTYANPTVV